MSAQLLATVDAAIQFVAQASKALGYDKQTFVKLVTRVDADRTNETQLPMLGLGTWLSKPGKVRSAVSLALSLGNRHIDCAAIYGNEEEVGQGMADAFAQGVRREDIFITTKLWNTKHEPKDVVPALRQSLSDLGLEYVDLYLIHWPTNFKAGDENVPRKEDGSVDYGRIVPHTETWAAMEECVRLGLTKHIGLSNFNEAQIANVLKSCKIRPSVLQCEGHPFLAQNALRAMCVEEGIVLEAYSPLGNPGRPAHWDHDQDAVMDSAEIKAIAAECGVSVADVCIRYQLDRGVVVMPKSVTPSRIRSNFEVWGFKLSEAQLKRMAALDRNQRYCLPTIVTSDGERKLRDAAHPDFPWSDTKYT